MKGIANSRNRRRAPFASWAACLAKTSPQEIERAIFSTPGGDDTINALAVLFIRAAIRRQAGQ